MELRSNRSRRASAPLRLPAFGREAVAIAQQGLLIARHLRRPAPAVRGARVVLFVHGFLAAGPVFDPMRAKVTEATGLATLDFSYGFVEGFHAVAARLARFVEAKVPEGVTVSLVGHSLGGLLARFYAEELEGGRRVDRLVTLATPHAGTALARFAPGPLREALVPGSALLRRLERPSTRRPPLPHTTVVAEADRTIVPLASAAAAPFARVHRVPGVGHNECLFHPEVHALIVEALR
jgi:pimeloyl-ACP methyl ester carboxylesterase